MTIRLDHMTRHFNRAAASYEDHTPVARQSLEELIDHLSLIQIQPETILDIGSGTGLSSRAIQKHYSKAKVLEVDLARNMLKESRHKSRGWFRAKPQLILADMHRLPFADNRVDLAFANLSVQWSPEPQQLFSELCRVVAPGGLLLFSSLGPDTLSELREVTHASDGKTHVNGFLDVQQYGDALMAAGFADPVLYREHLALEYESVQQILRQLKSSGITYAGHDGDAALKGKNWLEQISHQYEAFRNNGFLPATYELIYAHAWKPEKMTDPNRVGIPIENIGRVQR